jgi:hypothetical protein
MPLLALSVFNGWTNTVNLSNLAGSFNVYLDLKYFGADATLNVLGL